MSIDQIVPSTNDTNKSPDVSPNNQTAKEVVKDKIKTYVFGKKEYNEVGTNTEKKKFEFDYQTVNIQIYQPPQFNMTY